MQERRRHIRLKSSTIMQYKDGIFSTHVDTLARNLSLSGVCFFSDKKLKMGQVVKIRLFYDVKSPSKTLKGKIIWSTECNDGTVKGYLNGLELMR
jgi:hypothetical protein